jgi:hypothetical protein
MCKQVIGADESARMIIISINVQSKKSQTTRDQPFRTHPDQRPCRIEVRPSIKPDLTSTEYTNNSELDQTPSRTSRRLLNTTPFSN